tara:strand:- start:163 stop:348 length:186 start_codon:yes stop_codon:yes gene_type:complete
LLLIFLFVSIRAEFIVKEFSIIDGLIEGRIKDIFQNEIGEIPQFDSQLLKLLVLKKCLVVC